MAINGRIQREGDVVHMVAQQLFHLSSDLTWLADRDLEFRLPTGRGDEFAHGTLARPDSREPSGQGMKSRDIFIPDLYIDQLKLKSRMRRETRRLDRTLVSIAVAPIFS